MILWIIFALMTAAAILAVLWPLGRKSAAAPRRQRPCGLSGSIGGDRPRSQRRPDRPGRSRSGARRSLAAAVGRGRRAGDGRLSRQRMRRNRCAAAAPRRSRRWSCWPLLPLAFISRSARRMFRGSRPSPASRQRRATNRSTRWSARSRRIWQTSPNDGTGWEVIAPVYLRLGRFDDAVTARRKALALNGETATRDADLGEALVAAANGVVTDEAKHDFETRRDARSARGQGAVFSRSCRRAGRQPRRAPPRAGAPCSKRRRPTRRGSVSCAPRSAASPASPFRQPRARATRTSRPRRT